MNTLLVYPPWRQPFMPPLSLAALTGFLEAQGVACEQMDLNLRTFVRLLEPAWLERTGRELLRRIEVIEQNDRVDGETAFFHESLVGAFLRLPAMTRLVEEARRTLHQTERFYRLDEYRGAMRAIEEALGVVSLAWSPCRFLMHGHHSAAGDQQPAGQGKTATGGEERLLDTLFEEAVLSGIAEATPGLLLVLTDYHSQLLPALTLLRQVRRTLPDVRTAMAGWMAEELLTDPPAVVGLDGVIDVLVSGRPEGPLVRLSRALEAGSLDNAPGLVRRGPGHPPKVVAGKTVPVEQLPPPSFRGLPLDLYFSPEPVLPVRASTMAAEQIVSLGARHHCRRFLLTGALDAKTADTVAGRLSDRSSAHAWFGPLGRGEPLDEGLCRRLAAGGCVKLQLRVGPEGQGAGTKLLDQTRQAIRHCPPAGIGVHLHCRLDEETGGAAVVEPLSGLLANSGPSFSGPGISFSCRVVRSDRRGPAYGGSSPDLYSDATAPVPGAAPGFGRDPGDDDLPSEELGEERRWRLVREAGEVMGPCLTPGTAVHDFLYLAHFGGRPPAPEPPERAAAPALAPGLVLRPSPGLARGLFGTYDPVTVASSENVSTSTRFIAAGRRWWVSSGDGYHSRPLPEAALAILDACDGVRTWEEAVAAARSPDRPDGILPARLVRMMLVEGLLVSAQRLPGATGGAEL